MNISMMRAVSASRKIRENATHAEASAAWLAAKNQDSLDSIELDEYIKPERIKATPAPMIGDRYSNR